MPATATTPRTPPRAPADPRLYQTLLVLADGPTGVIERETGRLWACFPARRERVLLDLAVIDELAALGWVDLGESHDGVTVTARGAYWCDRYLRLNGGPK